MKRIVSLILALSMVLSMFTMFFAGTSLKDVEGTKYEAAVEALIELGVVSGYPDGTYLPNNVVTRAELAKLLVVAYGLEPAAEASKGVTPFADVNAVSNHWASGYVNVSADYKFVNGYPDGSFKADSTVTYAEAITMCLRVLGYANEIDSKGTWPTNYIAKAQDLKLMKDIEFSSYNDGAKRGDIAILIWNMLRTPMWEVTAETEGNGLESQPNRYMLNIKFSDYAYTDKATFEGYSIEENKDGEPKVMISLEDNVSDEDKKATSYNVLDAVDYEYAGNDFYKFAPGTEVEVLVNEEDGTLLTMVATDTDKVVAGSKDDIDDDYDELQDAYYDYAYARIESRAIADYTALAGESIYVDKLEKKDDYVKINKTKYSDKDYDGELFLKDGERVELRDIELGDVLTTVNVFTADGKEDTFYVIGGTEEEGKFKKYEEVQYENSKLTYMELTIADTKYVVDENATYVEDPEAKTIKDEDFYRLQKGTKTDKMEGEIVTIKLDPIFGKVVRVTFDGEIDAGEGFATEVKFFGVVSDVDKDSGSYTIELENEDDSSDTYTFAKNSDAEQAAKTAFAHGSTLVTGAYVACKLNDEDKITEITVVATADKDDKLADFAEPMDILYGEEGTNEKYVVTLVEKATYDDETKKIGEHKVNESTVVVKVVYDDGGTKTRTDDDEYRVEFSEGIDAVSKAIKEEDVLVVYDADSSFIRAKYVVLKTDKSDKSEKQVGTLDSANGDKIIVGKWVDITNEDDDEISAKLDSEIPEDTKLIVYTLRTNSKDEDLLSYVAGLTAEELNSGDYDKHGYVGEVEESGRIFLLNDDSSEERDIDDEEWADKYEDYLVVLVNVTEADDYTENGQYEVDTFETIDYADISLEEGDRISIDEDGEVIFIIRGMEVLELVD